MLLRSPFVAQGNNFIFSNALLSKPTQKIDNIIIFYSEFGDIYDEDHFIATLEDYVKVVKKLPEALMERHDYNITNVPTFHVQAWASVNYYLGEVYPVLQKQGYGSNTSNFRNILYKMGTLKTPLSERMCQPTELWQTIYIMKLVD